MTKDWIGNNKSTYVQLGSSNHTDKERDENDFYATDPKALITFLDHIDFKLNNIWECACGQGHLSEVLKSRELLGKSSDLINRGYGETIDFLTFEGSWGGIYSQTRLINMQKNS